MKGLTVTALLLLLLKTQIYPCESTVLQDYLQGVTPWVVTDYPAAHTAACRHPQREEAAEGQPPNLRRSCDPDAVFSPHDWMAIEQALLQTPRVRRLCGSATKTTIKEGEGENEEGEDSTVEVQYAIAVVRKMNLSKYRHYEDPHSRSAKHFAETLHNNWGVGETTECGGTGVLLFLSDLDRSVYISRGDALKEVLTDRRLDSVIATMKPFLQRQRYRDAVLHAIHEISEHIQAGKPQLFERITDFLVNYMGIVWVVIIFLLVGWQIRRDRAERREYARVSAHLDEIDRARAEALQGHFQMDSCPICLESYPKKDGEERPTVGSDGLPLKLLRCGHTFDDSCWTEWVSTGRGKIDKCLICQQYIGPRIEPEHSAMEQLAQPENTTDETEHAPNPTGEHERSSPNIRTIQRFQRERNFRIARLALRYPRLITNQQIERWTSSTYDGTLVRDPTFVQNDPAVRAARAKAASRNQSNGGSGGNSRSSGTSSNFGGGRSGGGRGGTW